MKALILALALTAAPLAQAANIVCKGTSKSSGFPFSIEIGDKEVTVKSGLLRRPHIIPITAEENGLIHGKGLAITFKNEFGCIRQATIITELREPFDAGYMETLDVGICSGGTTSDEICGLR